MVNLLPSLFIVKSKTGGLRPARRHTFVRQQKYAKVPSPCGGQLLCRVSETSNNVEHNKPARYRGAFLAV